MQLRLDLLHAAIEHFARGDGLAARLVGIGHREQRLEEARGALRGARLLLGEAPLLLRLVARLHGEHRQQRKREAAGERADRYLEEPPLPSRVVALHQAVERHLQQASRDLEHRGTPLVRPGTDVRGHGLRRRGRSDLTLLAYDIAQCRRHAVGGVALRGIAGLSRNDQGEDAVGTAE